MYKLIPAKSEHTDQLILLIASTGYWLAIRQDNKLGMTPESFMKEWVIKTYLPFTTVAVSENNESEVLGLVTAFPVSAYDSMPNSLQYFNDQAIHLISPLLNFPSPEDGYELQILAVAKNQQQQGIGQALFNHVEMQAHQAGFEKLFLFMHSCQNQALRFYLKNGMMIRNVIILDDIFPAKEMLYLEKSAETNRLLEHFDMPEAQALQLFK